MNPLNRLYKLKCHYDLHGLAGRTKRMLCEDVCHTTSDVKVICMYLWHYFKVTAINDFGTLCCLAVCKGKEYDGQPPSYV